MRTPRTYGSKTERERQANVANLLGKGLWYTYLIPDTKEQVRVFAMTEPGAFRVVREEHPNHIALFHKSSEHDPRTP